ncbi:hypothetical protein NDQ57_14085 [Rossellomorea marisflavi]|nr:hypothetical protein [Rossellomorea marisflavi]
MKQNLLEGLLLIQKEDRLTQKASLNLCEASELMTNHGLQTLEPGQDD